MIHEQMTQLACDGGEEVGAILPTAAA